MFTQKTKFMPLLMIGLLFTFSGCTGQDTTKKTTDQKKQTTTEEKKTTIEPKKTTETTKPSIEKKTDQSSWKTFSSEKYGFQIKYPSEFEETEKTEGNSDAFFFSKGEDNSHLFILPKGGFDHGFPSDSPTTSQKKIDGKNFSVREWQLAGNKTTIVYSPIESVSGWTTCKEDLMNCGRIELFATTKQDLEVLNQMVTDIKFTAQKN